MALDNFYGACLNEGFSLSVAVPFIDNLDWEEVDDVTMKPLAPEGEMAFLKGWVASDPTKENPLPFILILGRPKDRWMETESCTIYFKGVSAEEFASAFISETSAVEVDSETRLAEIYRSFTLPDNPDVLASLHYSTRAGADQIVVSAMHMNQPPFP
ncbi:hypothetical protein [Tabrizicola flagellatus]|uniref:hypothetical protein n=1 Tax=Tabrizicola flagellatus TaxID=2593021 RepID=UPI0011F2DC31|nr:hypothetical protein [Tabrizicola flagellatus]